MRMCVFAIIIVSTIRNIINVDFKNSVVGNNIQIFVFVILLTVVVGVESSCILELIQENVEFP